MLPSFGQGNWKNLRTLKMRTTLSWDQHLHVFECLQAARLPALLNLKLSIYNGFRWDILAEADWMKQLEQFEFDSDTYGLDDEAMQYYTGDQWQLLRLGKFDSLKTLNLIDWGKLPIYVSSMLEAYVKADSVKFPRMEHVFFGIDD